MVYNLTVESREKDMKAKKAESKRLDSGLQPALMAHEKFSINETLSPSHTENSPVTSAVAFGGSGSLG